MDRTGSTRILRAPLSDMTRRRSVRVQKLHRANFKTSGTRYADVIQIYAVEISPDAYLRQQMTLQEAQILVLRVLKQVMEEKLDHHNVQLAQVRIQAGFFVRDNTETPQVTHKEGFEILDEVRLKEIIDVM